MSNTLRSKLTFYGTVLAVAITSLALGFLLRHSYDEWETQDESMEIHLGQTDLINPLLSCRPENDNQLIPQAPLEKRINSLVEKMKRDGIITDIGLTFRDLNNGPSFAINADANYSGASLLKVPIMIGYLRISESRPDVLNESITYIGARHSASTHHQNILPPVPLVENQNYRVDELIARMITHSDNSATLMLGEHRPEADVLPTLQAMGVPLLIENDDAAISVRAYSSIFRILYNATFLNKMLSNAALKMLSNSEFKAGLVAGIPAGIPVAHKFGERSLEGGNSFQFHDCGIIYMPGRPYLLCVLSRGPDMAKLVPAIAEISKAVYEEVSK